MLQVESLIRGENLSKEYSLGLVREKVFASISLDVKVQEFVALTGPSGSGKSTLLGLLGFMDNPTSGEIYFLAKKVSSLSESELDNLRRTSIGFVFQNFNLFSALKVRENVSFSLFGRGLGREEEQDRALSALERVGMRNHSDKFPNQLSGGQRQRVAIARAIVHAPALIIADEPTASLDRQNSEEIISLLSSLKNDLKTTVIVASHDEDVYSRAERVLRLDDGVITDSAKVKYAVH